MEDKILAYVVGIGRKKGEFVDRDTDLFESGILDSLEVISLLLYLQEEFDTVFSPDDLQFENYQSVNKIIKWTKGQLKKGEVQ